MARKKENLELALTHITDSNGKRKFLMRNDNVTYELRKYDLSEVTQKFLFGMMYKISSKYIEPVIIEMLDEKRTYQYKIDVSELKILVNIDYNIQFHREKIDKLFKELVSTPLKIKTFDEVKKNETTIWTNLIKSIYFDNSKKYFIIEVEETALPLYKAVAGKFSIWGFEYITFTEKKYTPRIFELLVSFAKSIGDKNHKGIISKTYELDELKYELKIPDSYRFDHIKKSILDPCKNELLALDIEEDSHKFKLFKSFDYIPVELNINKKGRKAVGSITFTFELTDLTISRFNGEIFNESLKFEIDGEIKEISLQEAETTLTHWLKTTQNIYLCNFNDEFVDKAYKIIKEIKTEANISLISDKALSSAFKYFSEKLQTTDEERALNFLKICIKNNLKFHDKIVIEEQHLF